MRFILTRLPLLLTLAVAFSVASSRPVAAQPLALEQQMSEAYSELGVLSQPLVESLNDESGDSAAEFAPAIVEVTTHIMQLDSAAGGSLNREELARIYFLRGLANLALGQVAQSEADIRRAGRDWSIQGGFHGLRFSWALHAEDWSAVVDALEFEQEMAGEVEGTILGGWESRTAAQLSGELSSDEQAEERFAELLIRSGWIETVGSMNASWVYWDLFKARAGRGDEDGARAALANVTSLCAFAAILTENRFIEYRPAIEAEQGANLARGAANHLQMLEADWDEKSGDVEYLLDYLVALRMQARWQEIIDRFQPMVEDLSTAIDQGADDHLLMNGTGFFIVNYLAHAQIMLGDVEGGLARMEEIVALGLEAHPELISQAINRLSWLYDLGHHEQALSVAQDLDQTPEGIASDYAYALIYLTASCSAFQSDDQEASRYWRNKLLAIDDVSAYAMFQYHLCMADEEAAAEFLIAELQGDQPTGLLLYLQTMTLEQPTGPYMEAMQQVKVRVLARADVQAALADIGEIRTFALSTFYN